MNPIKLATVLNSLAKLAHRCGDNCKALDPESSEAYDAVACMLSRLAADVAQGILSVGEPLNPAELAQDEDVL